MIHICDIYINYIYFKFLAHHIAYKEYIKMSRMFKMTESLFHFLGQYLYAEIPPSGDGPSYGQLSVLHSTNWLVFTLFCFKAFHAFTIVVRLGCWSRNAT
jgi:hypothetical protein